MICNIAKHIKYVYHGADVKTTAVRTNECVMWGFKNKFIPQALKRFDEDPELEFAFFCEDDARVTGDVRACDLVKDARAASPSACVVIPRQQPVI